MALMAATLAPTCAMPVMAATRNQFVREYQMETENDNALAMKVRPSIKPIRDKSIVKSGQTTTDGIVLAL